MNIDKKEIKKEYEIIASFKSDGKQIDEVIENAFFKYLKYIDYK